MRSDRGRLPHAEALAEEYGMLQPGWHILLAVSGGRDSMALLHWMAAQADTGHLTLSVGHYHHGMRGESADRDQARVRDWCAERGIPFYARQGAVYDEAARQSRGVEEVGRELRYAFLEELAGRIGADAIATAHNADDNAETLLLHLLRGSGLQGLTGIPPRRGLLIRPLLTTTRADIDAYVAHHRVPYGDDCTNGDLAYARNRLRHQVTPVMESLNPLYVETAGETIRLLRRDNDYLNAQAAQLLLISRPCEQGLLMDAAFLAGRPFPISSRAVRQLLARLTGRTQFRQAHIQAVLDVAASPDPSAQASLPYGVLARRVYKDLLLTTQPAPVPLTPTPLAEGENAAGDWTVTLRGGPAGLVARPRQTGDALRLPKQARKSLKKLMIEKKIPRHLRDTLPVVADGDGVLAVAGLGENTDHPRHGEITVLFTRKSEKE